MTDYMTIRGKTTFEYEEKRSRFIATAAFAGTEKAALTCCKTAGRDTRTTANRPRRQGPRCWRRSGMPVFQM